MSDLVHVFNDLIVAAVTEHEPKLCCLVKPVGTLLGKAYCTDCGVSITKTITTLYMGKK